MMPESADSTGNGTRISRGSFLPNSTLSKTARSQPFHSSAGMRLVMPCVQSNSHTPLRFIHSARTICGRGYSGNTFSGVTSSAQDVMSGAAFFCQPNAAPDANTARTSESGIDLLMQESSFPSQSSDMFAAANGGLLRMKRNPPPQAAHP